MREPEVISAYVANIADKLDFDPSLSRRVRQEVEDHLWEKMSASSPTDGFTMAQEVIARFGDAQTLAAEFATVWLAEQARKLSAASVLLLLGLLVMMKARLAWYGLGQWTLADEVRAVGLTVGLVDAYAFWLAVGFAAAGWGLMFSHRVAASCKAQCRRIRCVVYLTSVSTFALMVSGACDVALTVFRLVGRDFSAQALIPIASVAAESALIGVLILKIGSLASCIPRATALMEPYTLRR
jgi:hypothetical protein